MGVWEKRVLDKSEKPVLAILHLKIPNLKSHVDKNNVTTGYAPQVKSLHKILPEQQYLNATSAYHTINKALYFSVWYVLGI